METCVRGFSFMPPQAKSSGISLQYVASDELERNWKASRRERLREQERRIWEDFVVNDQDVVSSYCKENPYEFLEQMPPEEIEAMLQIELQRMRQERDEEKKVTDSTPYSSNVEDSSPESDEPVQHGVTFADDSDKDGEMFHIIDDENERSGPEDEILNDSMGSLEPDTVREKMDNEYSARMSSPDKVSSKSSENIASTIEHSIYCAKIKDLRSKINDELLAIITSLERRNILNIDPEDLVRMCRRSNEFCNRFNRNHLYQLQRQIHDIKRNNAVTLPFAKHTQFQAQLVRITSLHQNMLQAFQVFHKSLEQTAMVRGCDDVLRALLQAARGGARVCAEAPRPAHLAAARGLYDDTLLKTCDALQTELNEYAAKMSSYMNSSVNTHTSHSKPSVKGKGKKRSLGTWSKSDSKTDAKLSMYSFDTRLNLYNKSSSSKELHSSGTSKVVGGVSSMKNARLKEQQESARQDKTKKKSPRARRPLMRDPQSGRAKRKVPQETDIRTMVEAVDIMTCTSSHISRDGSPDPPTTRRRTPRKTNDSTPRSPKKNTKTKPQRKQSPILRNRSPIKFNEQNLKTLMKTDQNLITNEISNLTQYSNKGCESTGDSSRVFQLEKELSDLDRPGVPKIPGLSGKLKAVTDSSAASKRSDSFDKDSSDGIIDSPWPMRHVEEVRVEKIDKEGKKTEEKKAANPTRCEVSRIVRQLCGGDTSGGTSARATGAKNVQLINVNEKSPRQPSTPQLLRILEETIQKKIPKPLFRKPQSPRDAERFRLVFNIPDPTQEKLFQYRTKFVQHMITSPMYANSVVGKPWEVIGRISDHIIDDLLSTCAQEMELPTVVETIYKQETH